MHVCFQTANCACCTVVKKVLLTHEKQRTAGMLGFCTRARPFLRQMWLLIILCLFVFAQHLLRLNYATWSCKHCASRGIGIYRMLALPMSWI